MIENYIKSYFKRKGVAGTQNEANRLKWLETTLKKIPTGSKILDAGAGELDKKKYCSHLDYVSQDFAQYNGKGDGKGLQTKKWDNTQLDIISDITNIPVADKSFDAIMCIEVFEHIPDPISALKEFSRILRPGGHLVITAPFCSLTHFAPYHFYTGFNTYFYDKYLKENGFIIDDMTANGNYFAYVSQELFRLKTISATYTNIRLNLVDKIAILLLGFKLNKLSRKDKGSAELLNFGIHIFAQKST